MKILLDTNVVLDVLLERTPHASAATHVFSIIEKGEAVGFLSATTITTIYYLATKTVGSSQAKKEINKLLKLFEIAPVSRMVLEDAVASKFTDFEDAVLHEAACHVGARMIVSRNVKDFQKASLPVYTPTEFIKMLK